MSTLRSSMAFEALDKALQADLCRIQCAGGRWIEGKLLAFNLETGWAVLRTADADLVVPEHEPRSQLGEILFGPAKPRPPRPVKVALFSLDGFEQLRWEVQSLQDL